MMKRLALLTLALPAFAADITPEQTAFFEKRIRPVLADACYKCHSAADQKRKGGLTLDTKEATLRGGECWQARRRRGQREPASSIYKAMTWEDEDMQMPPKEKLPAEVLANFKKWIEMGAPDPRRCACSWPKPRSRNRRAEEAAALGFQKPIGNEREVTRTDWPRTDIDKFVLADLEAKGLAPMARCRPSHLDPSHRLRPHRPAANP